MSCIRTVEGESNDRVSVAIPAPQLELLAAVASVVGGRGTGSKRMCVVLINGGMLELEPVKRLAGK